MSNYETVTEMHSAIGSDSPMRLVDDQGKIALEASNEIDFTGDLIEYMGTSDYELPAEIEPDEKYFEYVNEAIKQAQELGWTVERKITP